jgi:parallel beta-helix repeat protein
MDAKKNTPYNVKEYGAAGDGETDDTAAIQAAIQAGIGAHTYVPAGIYHTVSTINLPSHTQLVLDDGARIVNGSGNPLFIHKSDADNADITIQGGSFEGNHDSNTTQYALAGSDIARLKIRDCSFSYFSMGIYLINCSDFDITRNTIQDCGTTTAVSRKSLQLWGGVRGKITNNAVLSSGGYGIDLVADSTHSSHDIDVSSNKVWNCVMMGIIAAGGIHERLSISNNSCCYNGSGGSVKASQGGINVHGLDDGSISRNFCCFNVYSGIEVNGEFFGGDDNHTRSNHTIVAENICNDNGNIGIHILNSTYINVTGNKCRNNAINMQIYGVNTRKINILNNDLLDCGGTYNLYVLHGENVLIENNRFGEINSAATSVQELRIESNVKSAVLGWNDFSEARRSAGGVVIACTYDKVDHKHKQVWNSPEIDLSGGEVNQPLLMDTTSGASWIRRAYVVYTEGTDANEGVIVGIGDGTARKTAWAAATTEKNKPVNGRTELVINNNGQLNSPDVKPYFFCACRKRGSGKVRIVVEWIPSLPIYR